MGRLSTAPDEAAALPILSADKIVIRLDRTRPESAELLLVVAPRLRFWMSSAACGAFLEPAPALQPSAASPDQQCGQPPGD